MKNWQRRGLLFWVLIITTLGSGFLTAQEEKTDVRKISEAEYLSRMKAGWIGQMAGVGFGAPTEFRWMGKTGTQEELPVWSPEMVNQYNQDDLYVEMTFLRTLEKYGFDVNPRQAGIDFANSGYPLWHANCAGRDNLRAGIAPPDSGHPKFNPHADDIDYQIEADFAGLISPGHPNQVIALGNLFGRMMNYGDGVYGGVFVGAMYAEAFFETDIIKIVEAGLAAIPAESQYAGMVRDVLAWFRENPNDWRACWEKVEKKYQDDWAYRTVCCNDPAHPENPFNIDAKINGAYILIGLLYGQKDPDLTIAIATLCGQDSDCNPSSAAGVLFTSLGMENVPEKFYAALDESLKFSHTDYDFAGLIAVCQDLTKQGILRNGGKVTNQDGAVYYEIPVKKPDCGPCRQSNAPEEAKNLRFTEEEIQKINPPVQE